MPESRLGAEWRQEMDALLETLGVSLTEIIRGIDVRPTLPPDADAHLAAARGPLPETGIGGRKTLEKLRELAESSGGNTAGPRCFHFVIGGSTPAAHAADLMATAYEAMAYTWVLSPVAVRLEQLAMDWLKEMFQLPRFWSGLMVTGATMANFTCLAAARQWWGDQHGFDVSAEGLSGRPQVPVFSSGFLHASTSKVLALQGIGRGNTRILSRDGFGRIDLEALERELAALDGKPAIVIVNAGEVNGGEFDPAATMIEIARRHNCWVHVDGAFGMFARISPRTEHLVHGTEGADSLTVDGHKWLNVPYDSGFAFVREHSLLARAFRYSADYLPREDDPFPTPGAIGPESSRRARSFAVWATLSAYGREGHRRLVEHCLDLAQHLAQLVENHADLELMNDVQLNVVAFRFNPGGLDDAALDDLNERLGKRVLEDGRFLVGTSRWGERVVFRPAFSNWRTRFEDLDEFVRVLVALQSA